jgi:hypothetical protein
MRQWQMLASPSSPSTRNRTAPHWHPPEKLTASVLNHSSEGAPSVVTRDAEAGDGPNPRRALEHHLGEIGGSGPAVGFHEAIESSSNLAIQMSGQGSIACGAQAGGARLDHRALDRRHPRCGRAGTGAVREDVQE